MFSWGSVISGSEAMGVKAAPNNADAAILTIITIWCKLCLTVEEAAIYPHIEEHKLRAIANDPDKSILILRIGNKVVFKRPALESYIMGF